jgi:hypothetical protein
MAYLEDVEFGTVRADNLIVNDGTSIYPTFTIGAETPSTNTIIVHVDIEDADGNAVTGVRSLVCYVAADADGKDVHGTAIDTLTNGTDGDVVPMVAGKVFLGITESDGDLDISMVKTGAYTGYIAIVDPVTGAPHMSAAVTFAA